MEKTVYLDNSSTTEICAAAKRRMNEALSGAFGNPSSLHRMGYNAESLVEETRHKIADMIGAKDEEIYFTSGGTEGNNTAIFGAAYARKKRGNRIVTTAIEHPSVLEPVKRLEEEGFEVIRIKPQSDGTISEKSIFEAVNEKTVLVSIMLVNNETGAILPVSAARRAIEKAGAPAILHCDCVQAFGKLKIKIGELGADIITASAHKIHGPKGIGFIYVKKGVTVKPLLLGGGQEKGFRSGTQSVHDIYGFCGAIEDIGDIGQNFEKTAVLKDRLVNKLTESGLATVNSPEGALPYVVNVSVEGYRSETLLHFLEEENIYVSSGSACARGKGSHVLSAAGMPRSRVDSAIRVSFSRFNTGADVDAFVSALKAATASLRRVKK